MKIRRGEVWLANLSPTVGREQAGTRPVLISSSDLFNQSAAQLIFAIPITSKKKNIRSHVAIMPPEGGLTMPSYAMCEAMRSISKDCLAKPLGSVDAKSMDAVEDILKIVLDLS